VENIMFRIILSFLLTVFLFAGLISTASVMFASESNSDVEVTAQVTEKKDKSQTIKEIELETAYSNFHFTSGNALR